MQDGILKGTGNSRYLKSIETFLTQYPTYQDFAAALAAGTLPIDLNGINETGWDQLGTALNKANLLSDDTCELLYLDNTAVPNDALQELAKRASVGSIFWFAAQTAPDGYLICDGSAISRTDYASLFSVIGTTFGAGDGSTTFTLPNLRAAFIRGSGSNNGYSATFGQVQSPTGIGKNGAALYDLTNSDGGVGSVSYAVRPETTTRQTSFSFQGVRPYNIALTPIIKY